MNTAALIIVAGSVLVLGALAFGAAWAADRRYHLPVPAYAFGAAGAVLGGLISYGLIGGWFSGALWAEKVPVMKVLPYMAAIRQDEPQLFERLETSILRDQQDGRSVDEVRANAKSYVKSFVQDKIATMPDDVVYEVYAALRDDIAFLGAQKKHEICADFALARYKGDIDGELSPELADRNQTNILRVLSTKADPFASRMEREDFQKVTSEAFSGALQTTGIPPEKLDELLGGGGDQAETCRIMKAFFDSVLALPINDSARALRTISTGERW